MSGGGKGAKKGRIKTKEVGPEKDKTHPNLLLQNIIVSQCQINSSSITLLVGSSLINGNCLQDGEIIASSIIVDSSSQFVLQNWWTIQANEMTLSGMVYASVIHFSVNTLNIHGGINVDGQGSGPGAGPGAGISDASMYSFLLFLPH